MFEVANAQGQVQPGLFVAFAVPRVSDPRLELGHDDALGRASVTGRYARTPDRSRSARPRESTEPGNAIADLTSSAPGLRRQRRHQSAPRHTALPLPLVVEDKAPAGSTQPRRNRIALDRARAVALPLGHHYDRAAGRAINTLTPARGRREPVRVDADGGGSVTFTATATAAPSRHRCA